MAVASILILSLILWGSCAALLALSYVLGSEALLLLGLKTFVFVSVITLTLLMGRFLTRRRRIKGDAV